MIRNPALLAEFEDGELRKERLSYHKALELFEAMWREAVSLGVLPLREPLKDIEADIRLAGILNSCSKKS